MYHTMLAGCGRYLQGIDVLNQTGIQLKSIGCKHPFIIGGKMAMTAAMPKLSQSLETESISFEVSYFYGHCTDKAVNEFSDLLIKTGCDSIIGVGGGKALDTAKAVANQTIVPIICVPTSAATCAATTPLSVMYSEEGKQIRIDFFDHEVDIVLVDMEIIINAPARLLSAGIADSLAKLCEYSSPYSALDYGKKSVGIFCGYTLSLAANDILFENGPKACMDIEIHQLSQAVEECVFVSIGLIGIISGLGGYGGQGKGRFAIAHALNEVMRIYYPEIGNKWLHGEIVGVGVLAQLAVNNTDLSYMQKIRDLLVGIGAPDSLKKLSFPSKKDDVDKLIKYLMDCTSLEAEQKFLSDIIRKTI